MEKDILDIINKIGNYCRSEGLTLSVAESVTSGYLQYLFSHGEGTTSYFQGGITLYNNLQKFNQFNVSPILTLSNNGVSPLVSELLAIGVNLHFKTHLGIGITGFAKQDTAYNITQPHCYVAIAFNDKIIEVNQWESDFDSMALNQRYFAYQCVLQLHKSLIKLKISV